MKKAVRHLGKLTGAGRAVLLLALIACRAPAKQPTERPPVPVTVAPASVCDVPLEIAAIGNVQSFSTIVVTSRVAGQLVEVAIDEGREVQQGDLLFRVDPRPFELALRQAEAALARDRAQAVNARVEAERYQALVQKNLVSREQAEAYLSQSRALAASVRADAAAVATARVNLQYTTLRAPITGRTGSLQVNAGNVIAVGQPLITIRQLQPIYVAFAVPAKNLPAIRERAAAAAAGAPLAVRAKPSGEAQAREGQLSFIDNAVDPTTGTVLLKGTFANADRALWPGQFVDVALVLATLRAQVLVPSRAVQTGQQGQYLFVVDDQGVAQMRQVTLGPQIEGLVVVERGVGPGERAVTDGQLNLTSGTRVQIQAGASPGAASTASTGSAGSAAAAAAGGAGADGGAATSPPHGVGGSGAP